MTKNIRQAFLILLSVSLVFILSSCLTSKDPLGDKESSITDAALTGIWYQIDKDDPNRENYLAISQAEDDYLTLIPFDNIGGEPEYYRGYITEIDGNRYLNLQFVNSKLDIGDKYIFMYYNINENNELVLAPFKEDIFRKAVEENVLKGKISGKHFTDVLLTDSTENIVDFIRKRNKDEYLDEAMILKKLR